MMRVHITFVTTVGLPLDKSIPPRSEIASAAFGSNKYAHQTKTNLVVDGLCKTSLKG
jgi:hypothetical protein